MGVWEAIALTFVLLLALYGCAQAVIKTVLLLFRPINSSLKLTLSLERGDGIEQELRYATWFSKEWSIPLTIEKTDLSEEEQGILERMIIEKM